MVYLASIVCLCLTMSGGSIILPIAQESGRQVGPLRLPDASPQAFGSQVGEALQGVGEQVAALGGTLADRGQERQDRSEKYAAQTGLLQLETNFNKEEMKRQTEAPADPVGYNKTFISDFKSAGDAFLATVPTRLRPAVQEKLTVMQGNFDISTSKFEAEQRQGFRKTQIVEGMDTAAARLAVDPSQWRLADDDVIAQASNAGLSAPDTHALIMAWKEKRALTMAAIEAKNNPDGFGQRIAPEVAGGDGVVSPEAVIAKEENFSAKAYWDVDHYRAGYGSDTVTHADGTRERVKKDTVVTQEDAQRDLVRRTRISANTAANSVGTLAWGRLGDATHAAVTSVVYNYGHLPDSLVDPIRSGDKEQIAAAIEKLSSNPERRAREAAMVRSGVGPQGTHGVAPEFQDLPVAKRLTLYDQFLTDQSQLASQQRATADRAASNAKGSYELQISTDPEHVDTRAMLSDPTLKDMDKAALFNSWKTATGNTNDVRADLNSYTGGGLSLNPFSEKDRGRGEKVFEQLTKGVTDQNELKATTADFITKTGMVPQKVGAALQLGLASTVPATLTTALVDASNLYDRSKVAINAMTGGSDIRDQVAEFKTLIDGRGMSPPQAAQDIIMRRGTEWKITDAALKVASEAFVKTLTVGDITSQLNPPGWTGAPAAATPAVAAEMLADYQSIAREKLVTSRGDADVAKAQAQAEVLTLYNVSNATGSRVVMKYPPENYYPPVNGSHDYLQASVMRSAQMAANDLDPTTIRVGGKEPAGQVSAGNIDLFGEAGRAELGPVAVVRKVGTGYALLPTHAEDGTKQTADAAVAEFTKSGRTLGVFDTEANAIGYAQSVSAALPTYKEPKAKLGQIELQPYQDTTDDLRAGRPPRYILHYQEEQNGQMIWQTVLDHAWAATPAEMHIATATDAATRESQMKEQRRIVEEMRTQIDSGGAGIRQELMGGQ